MNPLAEELNQIIQHANGHIYEMLSEVGKNLFFPKGILTQSAEAKEKAHKYNATIGMAMEKGHTMHLPSVMAMIDGLKPEEALTYAPSFGIMPLRSAWKDEMIKKNPSLAAQSISLPVVTNAITHGMSVIADMWVDPGDAIILPDKMWGNYNMIFAVRRGAKILNFSLFDGDGNFHIEAFEKCLHAEAKKRDKIIVILNFPNNPTGYTITLQEGDEIADILGDLAQKGNNVLALTDDAYFGLFYEDAVLKESIFSRLVGRHPRLMAVKLDGATKENYVWGLRVGFITYGSCLNGDYARVYDALERKTAGAVRGSISNASHLGQSIILKSLQAGTYSAEKEEKFQIMKERALEVKRVLADSKYDSAWDVYPFNSGYFMCLRIRSVDAAFSCIEKEDIQELFDIILQGVKELGT
jgi:aspartate/methionine/tyrosine aminotransferase